MTGLPPPDAREAARLEIWQNRLAGICAEMGGALRRAAYSPNIKEREDFSCAVFDADGELVAQAEHIPVHLGSMQASVLAVLEGLGRIGPGDQAILNDPFSGGTHLNDITFVEGVYDGDRLIGFVANRAHHADVGGAVPGSLGLGVVDSVAEGLCLPPVLAVRSGGWDPGIRGVVLANTRTPDERAGDLDAQWGANRLGARRLRELAAAHGADLLARAMAAVNDHGERRMRAALERVQRRGAGTRTGGFADVVECRDGATARIEVTLTVADGRVLADFTGTDPAAPGCPCTVAAVTRACVEYAVRAVTDPSIPRNGGASRLVDVVAPPASVVAAEFPTPVGAGNVETSQRVVDVVLGALAGIFPDRGCGASQGTMNNILIGGRDGSGRPFVYYETMGGGQGGRPGAAGQSGIHTHMTNTANTPVEALEAEYPLLVHRYAIRRGSGGEGRWPGGDGIEREIELLTDADVTLLAQRRATEPWGLAGGSPGAPGRDTVLVGGVSSPLDPLGTTRWPAGSRIILRTPGGGGLGDASSR